MVVLWPTAQRLRSFPCAFSGATAIASPTIAARIESRRDSARAARERQDRDLAELRELLDKAAVSAEAARICSRRLARLFAGNDAGGSEAIASALEDLVAEGRNLRQLQARIAVRLGANGPVCTECKRATDELTRLHRLWDDWTDLYPNGPFDWGAQLNLERSYTEARDAFTEAARRRVGAETI